MSGRLMTSVLIKGRIDKFDNQGWLRWYQYISKLCDEIGIEMNYLGLIGSSFKSGKVLQRKRSEKRFSREIENGAEFRSVACYSLPDNFETAAFDYKIYIGRSCMFEVPRVLLTMESCDFNKLDSDLLVKSLSEHIEYEKGEIFEMSHLESPQIYAVGSNSISSFKTLKVLAEF